MEEGVAHATPDLTPTQPDPGRQSANREGEREGAPPAGPCEGGGRASAVWGVGCVERVAPADPAPASPDLSLMRCGEGGLGERAAGTGEGEDEGRHQHGGKERSEKRRHRDEG
jgi:hypothetical protein